MASGDTKTEQMLNVLANGGDASQFSGCCNTKTQNYILGAIDRVQTVEDEVEELKNNPDVVDIVDTYADLQAYDTQHLTDNDIIRVLQDETHSGNSTYYRFTKNPDTWTFIGEISGGGVTPVQTTGTSTTDVMSQNATTEMVYSDPTTKQMVRIGDSATANTYRNIAIGYYAQASKNYSIVIGAQSTVSGINSMALGPTCTATNDYSVAIGYNSKTTRNGEVNIGGTAGGGYSGTNYRVLGGVHDGQDIHDAATVAQGNTLATSAPTTSTEGVLGQLWTDTTNMHTYQCTAISGNTYTWTQRW